jgi:hypothetical protein
VYCTRAIGSVRSDHRQIGHAVANLKAAHAIAELIDFPDDIIDRELITESCATCLPYVRFASKLLPRSMRCRELTRRARSRRNRALCSALKIELSLRALEHQLKRDAGRCWFRPFPPGRPLFYGNRIAANTLWVPSVPKRAFAPQRDGRPTSPRREAPTSDTRRPADSSGCSAGAIRSRFARASASQKTRSRRKRNRHGPATLALILSWATASAAPGPPETRWCRARITLTE